MSTDDYSALRAEVASRVNKARGIPNDVQDRVRQLYFEAGLTAREIASTLNISHGAVRGTISRAYSMMTPEDRAKFGKHGGHWLKRVS